MTDQPPPPPAPTPAPASRPNGIWQLVVGIVLALIGLPNVIRGLSGIIATTTQPGMVNPGYPTGIMVFGLALVLVGVFLFRAFARIRAANRAADAGAAPAAPPPAV